MNNQKTPIKIAIYAGITAIFIGIYMISIVMDNQGSNAGGQGIGSAFNSLAAKDDKGYRFALCTRAGVSVPADLIACAESTAKMEEILSRYLYEDE
jgi:hypothetical protein